MIQTSAGRVGSGRRASAVKRLLCQAAAMVGVLCLGPALAQNDAPREATWITNGIVRTIVTTPTTVYLGGKFSYVGPNTGFGAPLTTANPGTAAATFPQVNGPIHACISDGAGGWYIGGSFTKVGSVTRNRLARVLANGTVDASWNPIVGNGSVYALALYSSAVYVGGDFTSAGGTTRNRIAKFGATGTGTLDSTWNPNANGVVYALAVGGSSLYVGGSFTNIGSQTRNRIAKLNTSSTGAADSGWNANAGGGVVRALAVTSSYVYAGGEFTTMGGTTRTRLAAVSTSSGSLQGNADPNVNGSVYAVAANATGTVVYVGGAFTSVKGTARSRIAALNNTVDTVQAFAPEADNTVRALAVDGSYVYAGGDFGNSIGGASRCGVAKLDGSTGAAVAGWTGAASSVYALALNSTATYLYVGSVYAGVGGKARSGLAAFDRATGVATDWDPSPNAGSTVNALAVSGATVYAGGDFTSIGGQTRNRIAALDATLATNNATPWDPNANNTVHTLAASGSTLYVGGSFSNIAAQTRNSLAAFDVGTGVLTAWNPSAGGTVNVLKVSENTVYAGGSFMTMGGSSRSRIAAIDATTGTVTSWNPGATTAVYALAVSGSTVYVGGNFTSLGGQTRNYIGAVSAATGLATGWNPGASGTSPYVNALEVAGTTVYAAGLFTTIGGQTRNYLAALSTTVNTNNAKAWNPNASIHGYALALDGGVVYAGGEFTTIGGVPRTCFAQFDPTLPAAPTSPNATAVGTETITWTWVDNSDNEAGFKVYADPGATAPTTLQATTAPEATSWTYGGLTANAQYAFQVAATNVTGDSAKTSTRTTWTQIEAVSGLVFSNLGTDRIDVAPANTPSNLTAGISGLYLANTTAGTNSGWVRNTDPWSSAGLTPNTPYTFTGMSRNGGGTPTSQTTAQLYTLANPPAAPTVGNPTAATLDVAIGAGDGNPAATEYAIQISPAPGGNPWVQADGSPGAAAAWQTAAAWDTIVVTGLTGDTTYTITVQARNGDAVETDAGSGTEASTTGAPAGSATPATPDLLPDSDTGTSATDNLTNRNNSTAGRTLQFSVADTVAGATVTVYAGDVPIGSAAADGTTTIVTTNGTETLADGAHAIAAKQQEAGKEVSVASAVLPLTIDTTPPAVLALSPANGSAGVALPTSLVITFDEPVARGTGAIGIHRTDTAALVESFDAAESNRLSFSQTSQPNDTVTVDPSDDLPGHLGLAITVGNTCFADHAGNLFAGLAGAAAWSFETLNRPPVAGNDTAAVDEDAPATPIDVLVNDVEPDGETLVITGVTQGSSGGAVLITGGGTGLTYQPAADFNGEDVFTYTISDGAAGSEDTATVTVTVTAVNDPPVNTTAPAVSGTAAVGETLSVTPGVWNDTKDGNPEPTLGRQWRRATDAGGSGAVDIPDATGTTYVLSAADGGAYVCVVETATDAGTPGTASAAAATPWQRVAVHHPHDADRDWTLSQSEVQAARAAWAAGALATADPDAYMLWAVELHKAGGYHDDPGQVDHKVWQPGTE